MEHRDGTPRALRRVLSYRDLRTGSSNKDQTAQDHSRRKRASLREVFDSLCLDTFIDRPTSIIEARLKPDRYFGIQSESRLNLSGTDQTETPNRVSLTALPQQFDEKPKANTKDQRYSQITVWKEIWAPLLWVHGSMFLMLAILTVVISVYKVKGVKGLFFEPTGWIYTKERAYVLLSIPASELLSWSTSELD